jgi:hypothetical protein
LDPTHRQHIKRVIEHERLIARKTDRLDL